MSWLFKDVAPTAVGTTLRLTETTMYVTPWTVCALARKPHRRQQELEKNSWCFDIHDYMLSQQLPDSIPSRSRFYWRVQVFCLGTSVTSSPPAKNNVHGLKNGYIQRPRMPFFVLVVFVYCTVREKEGRDAATVHSNHTCIIYIYIYVCI